MIDNMSVFVASFEASVITAKLNVYGRQGWIPWSMIEREDHRGEVGGTIVFLYRPTQLGPARR